MITVIRKIKYPLLSIAVLFCFLMFSDSAKAQVSSFIDIGFRVNQGTQASPSIERVAIENPADSVSSPLKLAKNGIVYRVALVDPSDPLALNVRIRLPGNITKALRKYVENVYPEFENKAVNLKGSCSAGRTTWSGEISLTNNSSSEFEFIKDSTSGNGRSPNSFIVGPNSTKTIPGFGYLFYDSRNCVAVPAGIVIEGSVTYLIKQNNVYTGKTVTYNWEYYQ